MLFRFLSTVVPLSVRALSLFLSEYSAFFVECWISFCQKVVPLSDRMECCAFSLYRILPRVFFCHNTVPFGSACCAFFNVICIDTGKSRVHRLDRACFRRRSGRSYGRCGSRSSASA